MGKNLLCVECGTTEHRFKRGWRGFLTDDEFSPTVVAILCPACAWREFGPPMPRLRRPVEDD
jgi:hypothetical protein